MNIRRQRQLCIWSAILLLIGAAAAGFYVWQEEGRLKAQLRDTENRILAFEDRLRTREQVLAEIRLLEARNPSGSLLLSGETPAIAAAELQGIVNNTVESANGNIISSQLLKPEDIEPFLEVGISLQFIGTIESLREILYQLEQSIPAVVVTGIKAVQDDEFTRELRVSLKIKGFASVAAS